MLRFYVLQNEHTESQNERYVIFAGIIIELNVK